MKVRNRILNIFLAVMLVFTTLLSTNKEVFATTAPSAIDVQNDGNGTQEDYDGNNLRYRLTKTIEEKDYVSKKATVTIGAEGGTVKSSQSTDKSIDIVLIADTSGSMKDNGRIGTLKKALKETFKSLKQLEDSNAALKGKIRVGLISFSDKAIMKIINEYTREAGVRNLRREIGKLFRKIAKEILVSKSKSKKISVSETKIKKYLGNAKFRADKVKEKEGKIGVVNGLAWTAVGGTTLEVQAVKMEGKGVLQLTGKLGDVMQESARVAYSYVRHIKNELGIKEKFNETTDVHLHFPEGAVPKDGPSAGITITTAIISVLTDKEVRQDVAMTGEITITGEVLAVGGIKEKVIGAHRVGIRDVVLPYDNKVDTEELPKEIADQMKFYFAKTYDDVKKIVFVDKKNKEAKKSKAVKKTAGK